MGLQVVNVCSWADVTGEESHTLTPPKIRISMASPQQILISLLIKRAVVLRTWVGSAKEEQSQFNMIATHEYLCIQPQ